jgi:parvulin-like peptidyl-prolyl cis-trans isomerase-like protein
MADQQPGTAPREVRRPWRVTAHLLGFGMLLAVGILLAKGPPVDEAVTRRVTFTGADVAQVHAMFERTWSRPPTAAELQRAFEAYVRNEVLYREAVERGLDRNDPVVRMSLVRKITMLGAAQVEAAEPTDDEVKAYFSMRAERYRAPASISMVQVCLFPDKRSDTIQADAEKLLAQLRRRDPPPEQLRPLGDARMLPAECRDMAAPEIASTFGPGFRDAVLSLPAGRWEGPVKSGFGLHLVKVTRREESRIPALTEVRGRVMKDMRYEGRRAAEDQLYAEILPRYRVECDDVASAVLGSKAR